MIVECYQSFFIKNSQAPKNSVTSIVTEYSSAS